MFRIVESCWPVRMRTEGNDIARKLYEKFGFVETDRDEDEIIMELQLI